jgi:hypothetical protein
VQSHSRKEEERVIHTRVFKAFVVVPSFGVGIVDTWRLIEVN